MFFISLYRAIYSLFSFLINLLQKLSLCNYRLKILTFYSIFATSRLLISKGRENYIEDYGQITSKVGQWEVNGDYRPITPTFAMTKTWSFGLDDPILGVVHTASEARRGYKFVKN